MAAAIQVRFEGLPDSFPAKRWHIPNHTLSFAPLPSDITFLRVSQTKSLYMNRDGDRLPYELGLEEASKWGFNGEEDKEVTFAKAMSADGSKWFCLRMIMNAERTTVNPQSNTFKVSNRLLRDAKFHSTHLTKAEGFFVPFHYGVWLMDTGKWAGKVLFSLMQWVGTPWTVLSQTVMNTEANRILIGRTFEALHDCGVDHGAIRNPSDFRHVLIDTRVPGLTRADMLNGKARCYIVDFARAHAKHRCERRVPILPHDRYLRLKEVGCGGISDILILLDFYNSRWPTTSASAALEWHTKYSQLYPDLSNPKVMIAQRARMYPTMAPVYHVDISFESEDPYAKATLIHYSKEVTKMEKTDDETAGKIVADNFQSLKLQDPVLGC
ncbi:hypothetical protein DFH09DRAFT_266631 [Mycena vulgaris]|nr:hypothetical protein DFH09DRAFT_266631 [Mycena vulgaris]